MRSERQENYIFLVFRSQSIKFLGCLKITSIGLSVFRDGVIVTDRTIIAVCSLVSPVFNYTTHLIRIITLGPP